MCVCMHALVAHKPAYFLFPQTFQGGKEWNWAQAHTCASSVTPYNRKESLGPEQGRTWPASQFVIEGGTRASQAHVLGFACPVGSLGRVEKMLWKVFWPLEQPSVAVGAGQRGTPFPVCRPRMLRTPDDLS